MTEESKPLERTNIYHNCTTFYYGSNFNLGGTPRVDVARAVIATLERVTGWKCTSRWPWSPHHGGQSFGSTREIMALTDLTDIARADNVILLPLNGTARGCHVEMGAALAWDKPTYLWRPNGEEGTSFDSICVEFPQEWKIAVYEVLETLQGLMPGGPRAPGRRKP